MRPVTKMRATLIQRSRVIEADRPAAPSPRIAILRPFGALVISVMNDPTNWKWSASMLPS
jgi:hypothetical protein